MDNGFSRGDYWFLSTDRIFRLGSQEIGKGSLLVFFKEIGWMYQGSNNKGNDQGLFFGIGFVFQRINRMTIQRWSENFATHNLFAIRPFVFDFWSKFIDKCHANQNTNGGGYRGSTIFCHEGT